MRPGLFYFLAALIFFLPLPELHAARTDFRDRKAHAYELLKDKDYQAALKELQALEPEAPDDLALKKVIADLCLRIADFSLAQQKYEELLKQDPHGHFGQEANTKLKILKKSRRAAPSSAMPLEAFLQTDASRAFSSGEWAAALKGFEELLRQYPEDILVQRFRGLALLRLDQYAQAEDQFQRILIREPGHVAAHFNLGQVLLKKGEKDRAGKELDWVRRHDTTSDQFYAKQVPKILKGRNASKRWSFSAVSSYEYDTNALFKSTDPFYSTGGDQNSGRYPLNLSAAYKIYQTKKWTFTGDAFYAHTLYNDFLRLNTYILGGGLSALYAFNLWNRPSYLNIREGVLDTSLRNKFYSFSNAASANWIYDWRPRFRLAVNYRQYINEYAGDGTQPGLTRRDGFSHLAGILNTYYWNRAKTCYLSAGYDFEHHATRGKNFIENSHGGRLRQHFPILKRIEGDLLFIFKYNDYPKYGFADPSRRDFVFYLTPSLSREIFKNTQLTLSYTYENSRGRNNAYEYFRNLFSIQLAYRY